MSAYESAKTFWLWFWIIVAGLVLAAAVGVGGYLGGWWLNEDIVERGTRIDNTRTGVQDAWRSEAIRTIRDVQLLPESADAQRVALTNQACDLIGKLSGTFADDPIITEFAEENCT